MSFVLRWGTDSRLMDIALMGNSLLRVAIQRNLASFPSQVPALTGRNQCRLQIRMAQLYFGRGWSVRDICGRYGLGKAAVHSLLNEWRIRAIASGYIQEIDRGGLEALAAGARVDENETR